ncbi:MAG: hypothetical protein Q9198_008043 [Flavoplaca austrocitrina]
MPKSALRFAHAPHTAELSRFMSSLVIGSEMLNEVADQFMPIMKQYRVFNFWEELQSEVDGTMTYVVDRDSAAPNWADTEQCGIRSPHSGMLKFDSTRDSGYIVITEALTRYTRSAPDAIKSRWINEKQFLDLEHRKQAEELLKPQLAFGSSMDEDAECSTEYYLVSHCSSIQFTGRKQQAQELKEKLRRPIISPDQKTRGQHKVVVIRGLEAPANLSFA